MIQMIHSLFINGKCSTYLKNSQKPLGVVGKMWLSVKLRVLNPCLTKQGVEEAPVAAEQVVCPVVDAPSTSSALWRYNMFNTLEHMGVSQNRGTPKMDGESNGKPYWNGWFGGTPILGNTHIAILEHMTGFQKAKPGLIHGERIANLNLYMDNKTLQYICI